MAAKKKAQPKRQRRARGGARGGPSGRGQGAVVELLDFGVRIIFPDRTGKGTVDVPTDVRQN